VTLYYEPDPDRARELVALLGGAPRLARSLGELADLAHAGLAGPLVVLGPGVALADALAFAERERLSTGVVLLRDSVDVTVLGGAIKAGIREVVDACDGPAIRAACARSLEVSRQLDGRASGSGGIGALPDGTAREGKLVTVFAGKGGCGKSTVATNVAVALAAGGARRVCLVDLDLSFGDVAIMLQLVPERSMVDAVPMVGRLDETGLRSLLTPFAPGVSTLLAPAGPADGERVTRELVAELLGVARRMFDFIVVDSPPFFSDQVLAALDDSDHYVLIATPDIPSLKNLRLTLDMFDLLEYAKDRRIVVLNRADSRVGLTESDIERVIRAPIRTYIPSTKDVPVSINKGMPLMVESPGHPVSRALRELAEQHIGAGEPVPVPARKSKFSLRFGGGK
jgi:pilus assembly protein CpaE